MTSKVRGKIKDEVVRKLTRRRNDEKRLWNEKKWEETKDVCTFNFFPDNEEMKDTSRRRFDDISRDGDRRYFWVKGEMRRIGSV